MTIDTNELRRLAQAATPGPWYVTGKLTRYVEARIDGGLIQEVAACGPTKADGGYGPQQEANARLLAAANPAAISELIDRLEAAEKERDALRTNLDDHRALVFVLRKEVEKFRAKVVEMEKQEPVTWMQSTHLSSFKNRLCGSQSSYVHCSDHQLHPDFKPLYTLPGAQGEGK